MRNFSDPISKPLFQPACLYNLLFVNSLSYTTDSKIDEFKIMNSKIWWVQCIYWTRPNKGPYNFIDWITFNNFFLDILQS